MQYLMIADTVNYISSPLALSYPSILMLAQLCKASEYRAVTIMKRMMGHYVVLDNGAHEGIDFDVDEYVELVKELLPSTVVLSDLVGRPFRDSYEVSYACMRKIKERVPEYSGYFMVAPQGTDQEDTIRAFDHFLDFRDGVWAESDIILGIGCCWEHWCRPDKPTDRDREDTRIRMIQEIHKHTGLMQWELPVHILGARWDAGVANQFYNNWSAAKWIDTIKPCTCASNRMLYPHIPDAKRLKLDDIDAPRVDDVHWFNNIRRFCAAYGAEIAVPNKESSKCMTAIAESFWNYAQKN